LLYSPFMKQIIFLITLLFVALFSGCIKISQEYYTLGHNGEASLTTQNPICENNRAIVLPRQYKPVNTELDPAEFTLLNWNSYKGAKEGWVETFSKLSGDRDLVTLQEGYITDELSYSLTQNAFTWDMAAAFSQNNISAGVLTASKVAPEALCSFWDEEPILGIPKTAIITRYKFKDTPQTLLLINIHMINFTMGTESFTKQLSKVQSIITEHDGPVILAGDFNTWSERRQEILVDLTTSLTLQPISYSEDHRTRFMGEVVDHVYTRGLDVLAARAISVNASDHNPILATFTVKNAPLISKHDIRINTVTSK
jgi:endonuclease/exonuclease/phosphatase (EEP) superfamily protein YafD